MRLKSGQSVQAAWDNLERINSAKMALKNLRLPTGRNPRIGFNGSSDIVVADSAFDGFSAELCQEVAGLNFSPCSFAESRFAGEALYNVER
jgi:hypothetical protein